MSLPSTRRRAAAAAALATGAPALLLTACGVGARAAADVTTSTSGAVVTSTSTDLGSIVLGWGERHSDTEITTPRPEDVTARCTGRGDDLAVDIAAPHGWTIQARHGSPVLTVANTDQNLPAADIDTTHQVLDVLHGVDWSETDQVDIAATADAPLDWKPTHSGRIQLSIHIDCR
ncbi:hypothetical protein GCM10023094_55210 [Rhodococcus olei]|uniref:Lipoprotein n=1 Tax=Rhodococcus olei TaxID=2161675 RepID=A0ABP8PPI5_9NOCA